MTLNRRSSGEVLVAILRNQLDFSVLRERLWYRIPVDSVEKYLTGRWPPSWLAFYQTKIFGPSRYSIRYYGRVLQINRVRRSDLFPDEPRDERSLREYYQLFVNGLEELPRPIPSRRLRRLAFIPTTWPKLLAADEINDLYDDSPLEDDLWRLFKTLGIGAERQERVQIRGQKLLLGLRHLLRERKARRRSRRGHLPLESRKSRDRQPATQ